MPEDQLDKEGPDMNIGSGEGSKFESATSSDDIDSEFYTNLIESAADRPPSSSPYLSGTVVKYILDSSSKERKSKEREAEEAAEDLSLRFYRLLYDLAILSAGGYLDDINDNWDCLDEDKFFRESFRNCYTNDITCKQEDPYFNWGFDFGLALSSMTGTTSESIRASQFVSGLVTAYSVDRLNTIDDPSPDMSFYQDKKLNNAKNVEREIFDQYGVEYTEFMRTAILVKEFGTRTQDSPHIPESAIENFFETKLNSYFGKCSSLRKDMEKEWQQSGRDPIKRASVPGLNSKKTLKALWSLKFNDGDTSTKARSSDIAAELPEKTDKRQVSQVLNQLSIEGKEPADSVESVFENSEVVYYKSGGWRLTDYGRLLLYHVFERDMEAGWMQAAALKIRKPGTSGPPPRYSEEGAEILDSAVDAYFD